MVTVVAANVAFDKQWSKIWSALTSGWSGLATALAIIGMIMVVAAVLKWIYDKRKGSGNAQPMWIAIIIGGVMAAPTVIVPLMLKLLSAVVNIAIKLFDAII